MKVRQSVAALALLLLPGAALAEGCHDRSHDTTAMSCAEGHVWDETKGLCVLQPSS